MTGRLQPELNRERSKARTRARARGPDRRRRRRRAGARSDRPDPPEPEAAAEALRARGDAGARRVDPGAGDHPAGRPAPACRGRLRARRGRAALAGGARGEPADACRRSCGTRPIATRCLLGLVENVAREELTPIEEARAFAVLVDEFELSLGDIAERVGASKPAVSNRLRLLELSDDILAMVERGELTEGHARAVLAVPDNEGRRRLAREDRAAGAVGAGRRSARRAGPGAATKRRRRPPADPQLAERVKIAAERLTGFRVRVSARGLEIPVDERGSARGAREALEAAAADVRRVARGSRVAGGDLAGRRGAPDLLAHGGNVPGGPVWGRSSIELAGTPDLDDFTKGTLSEIARDEAFLLDGGRLPAPARKSCTSSRFAGSRTLTFAAAARFAAAAHRRCRTSNDESD